MSDTIRRGRVSRPKTANGNLPGKCKPTTERFPPNRLHSTSYCGGRVMTRPYGWNLPLPGCGYGSVAWGGGGVMTPPYGIGVLRQNGHPGTGVPTTAERTPGDGCPYYVRTDTRGRVSLLRQNGHPGTGVPTGMHGGGKPPPCYVKTPAESFSGRFWFGIILFSERRWG